jgi:hypothetical protein
VRSPVASVEFIRAGTGAVAKMDLSRFRLAAARGGVPTRKSVQILARFAVSFGRVTPKGQQLLPLSGNFLKSGTLRVLVYVVDHFRQVTRRYCSRRFSQSREYFGNFGMAARPRVQPGEKLRLVFRTELIARGHEVDCRFVLHSFSVTRCPWR